MGLVERSAPSQTKKIVHGVGAANLKHRSLGTVLPHQKRKCMMMRTRTDWNPIRELLETSALKEGADIAVGM
jgi:hypothetical protein